MTGFSDDQLAALRAPLAREHVKGRQQAGRTLSYLEGWHVIAEANRIFGFDAWDRETVDCRCVSERAAKLGANKDRDGWRVAYVGKVRVTVRAGERVIVREGTGYGSGIDADVGEAHESAAKECETDSLKRALMTFGNPMGLALYDKAQAEVEPVAARRPAQAPQTPAGEPTATPPSSPLPNGVTVVGRTSEADKLLIRAIEIKDLIKVLIEKAKTPDVITGILKVNAADLQFVKEYNEKTYERLMQLAAVRTSELRASA